MQKFTKEKGVPIFKLSLSVLILNMNLGWEIQLSGQTTCVANVKSWSQYPIFPPSPKWDVFLCFMIIKQKKEQRMAQEIRPTKYFTPNLLRNLWSIITCSSEKPQNLGAVTFSVSLGKSRICRCDNSLPSLTASECQNQDLNLLGKSQESVLWSGHTMVGSQPRHIPRKSEWATWDQKSRVVLDTHRLRWSKEKTPAPREIQCQESSEWTL